VNDHTHYTAHELWNMGIAVGESVLISRRVAFYAIGKIEIGDHSRIDDGCILTGSVKIGKRVHLAPYCVLYGKAGIAIGDYSGFGVSTIMHSESDDYSGRSMFGPCVPAEYQPFKHRAPIAIGRAVLGGARCTILPGVTIADGVCIGAHSVVKGDCEGDTIYAGVPAKALRRAQAGIWSLTKQFELDHPE
jgi:acetyltransferase-like isoleucine patch superfamily enzyme